MKNKVSIKFIYSIFIILSFLYIILLFNIAFSHYSEISFKNNINIEDTLLNYNWKYWFELKSNTYSYFASFLEYLDSNFLHTQGAVLLLSNFVFLFLLVYLIYKIIHNIFSNFDNSKEIESFLLFFTIILIFSALQDEPIVWMFNHQIFAGYYFILLSYYLLIDYINTKNIKKLYWLIISSTFIVFTIWNSYFALMILILVSLFINTSLSSRLSIIGVFIVSIIINYKNILYYFNDIEKIIHSNISLLQILKYILTYLGSVFVYISYEPCFATSAILGGIFLIGTFIFISYLLLTNRVKENFVWVIWSYLFYYILDAFANLDKIANSNIILFRNQYITPSLISWVLIAIFYIYYFYSKKIVLKRLLVVCLTFLSILYIYQIKSYFKDSENKNNYKLSIYTLKNNINNDYLLNKVSNLTYIIFYTPKDKHDKQLTVFTLSSIKQNIIKNTINNIKHIELFSNLNKKEKKTTLLKDGRDYKGFIDKIHNIKKNLYSITGWIYDLKREKIPSTLLILNDKNNMIGYIIPRLPRKDVEKIYGYKALRSGFTGYFKASKVPSIIKMLDLENNTIIKSEKPRIQ